MAVLFYLRHQIRNAVKNRQTAAVSRIIPLNNHNDCKRIRDMPEIPDNPALSVPEPEL